PLNFLFSLWLDLCCFLVSWIVGTANGTLLGDPWLPYEKKPNTTNGLVKISLESDVFKFLRI
ncbi:MAG: hypothetical protein ACPLGZ_01800, partial [Candidatus Pelagibacter ubique]